MHPSSNISTATQPAGSFILAARDAGPVWLGMIALGFGFGVLVTSTGFPWWLAPVISILVYAGSVEFLLIGMLLVSAPVSTIAITTFLVNSRHVFYGLTFPLHRLRGWQKLYCVYSLTDEAYVLVSRHNPNNLSAKQILWTHFGLQLSWVGGSFLGAIAGKAFLAKLAGVDFVLTALFIVLAMEAYRARPDRFTAIAALICATGAVLFAGQAMLLTAMCAFVIICLARHSFKRRAIRDIRDSSEVPHDV